MASAVVDELVTRFRLDDQYSTRARRVVSSTNDIAGAQSRAFRVSGSFKSVLGGLGGALGGLAGPLMQIVEMIGRALVVAITAAVAAIGAATAAFTTFTFSAMKQAAEIDALKKAIESTAGSAEAGARAMELFMKASKVPGLGFKEALEAGNKLMNIGMTDEGAFKTMLALANALTKAGGNKEQFDGVVLALSQIAAKGKVAAQEVNQLAERISFIRELMKKAFGTASGEELEKRGIGSQEFIVGLVAALEQIPVVTGSAKTAFENLGDAWDRLMVGWGTVFNEKLAPVFAKIEGFFDYLVDGGVIERIANSFASLFGDPGDGIINMLSSVVAAIERIPALIQAIKPFVMSLIEIAKNVTIGFIAAFQIVLDQAVMGLTMLLLPLVNLPLVGKHASKALVGLYDFKKKEWDALAGVLQFFGGISADAGKVKSDFGTWQAEQKNKPDPHKQARSMPTTLESMFKEVEKKQSETAKNTEELVRIQKEQLDLQRYALGGGDLGKFGVTPEEMSRFYRGNAGKVKVINAGPLREALEAMFGQYNLTWAREGA